MSAGSLWLAVACLKTGHDREVGGGEVEAREFGGLHPAEFGVFVRVGSGARGREAANERKHLDDDGAVVVREAREGAEDGDFATKLLAELADEGGFGGLAGLDLAAGEFPF